MPKREKARTFVENENDKHCMFNFMLYFVLKSKKNFSSFHVIMIMYTTLSSVVHMNKKKK